jgi:hypothetical protein
MRFKSTPVTWSRYLRLLGNDGAAAVELAITAPMLVVLVMGIADYGLLAADSAALEGAARAGAEVGKAKPNVTATQLTTLNLFPSGITPTVTSVCTCVDNTWPTGSACPPGPFATPCAGKTNPFITGAPVDPRVFEYVQVSATQSVRPIVSYGTYTSAKSVNVNTTIRFQ